jgi:hypothetical protein
VTGEMVRLGWAWVLLLLDWAGLGWVEGVTLVYCWACSEQWVEGGLRIEKARLQRGPGEL